MNDLILKRIEEAYSFCNYDKNIINEYKELFVKVYLLGFIDNDE